VPDHRDTSSSSRDRRGRFLPGHSGNPAGRPPARRNQNHAAIAHSDLLGALQAGQPIPQPLLDLLWQQALSGSVAAAKTLLASQIGGIDVGQPPSTSASDGTADPQAAAEIAERLTDRIIAAQLQTAAATADTDTPRTCPACAQQITPEIWRQMTEASHQRIKARRSELSTAELRRRYYAWQAHDRDPATHPRPDFPRPDPDHNPSAFPEIVDPISGSHP